MTPIPTKVLAAAEESMFGMTDTGFCLACGAESFHVELDAANYECEECGDLEVFGAAEILLRGLV